MANFYSNLNLKRNQLLLPVIHPSGGIPDGTNVQGQLYFRNDEDNEQIFLCTAGGDDGTWVPLYNNITALTNGGLTVGPDGVGQEFQTISLGLSNLLAITNGGQSLAAADVMGVHDITASAPRKVTMTQLAAYMATANPDSGNTWVNLDGTTDGYVTAQGTSDTTKFLNGNGAWSTPAYIADTWINLDGTTDGYVTAQGTSDTTKFLNGNGAWSTPAYIADTWINLDGTTDGYVTAQGTSDTTKFLNGNGAWSTPAYIADTWINLDGTTDGYVTAQGTSDTTKFLNGNGAWSTPAYNTFDGAYTSLSSIPTTLVHDNASSTFGAAMTVAMSVLTQIVLVT